MLEKAHNLQSTIARRIYRRYVIVMYNLPYADHRDDSSGTFFFTSPQSQR